LNALNTLIDMPKRVEAGFWHQASATIASVMPPIAHFFVAIR
jgi:hypothetical protein